MQIYLYTHSQLEARNANAVRAEKAVRRWSESQAENGFYTCQVLARWVYCARKNAGNI